jgi:transposase
MAGKTRPMSQIKQLLQLHRQGKRIKEIARLLDLSKNTVKSYLRKLASSGVNPDILLELDDPVLEARFHAGNPAYLDDRFIDFKDRIEAMEKDLKKTGVTKKLLWQEYRQENPGGYSYTQFCYHLSQHQLAKKPSMVITHQPGEKLFIDFAGDKLGYIDRQTGEIIECNVFVACMPFSDYSFAMAVRTQGIEDFLHALACCLSHLGGVPKIVVPDNLKSAITKASRYEPDINQAFEDFANHYGFVVIPTRVKKPKDKAQVENEVRLIYNRVYAKLRNITFFDLHSLNEAIAQMIGQHNQTRMQLKPWSREEKFLAEEKPLLGKLPEASYEVKYYTELKVAQNNHICLWCDKHYYSVPFIHTGLKAKVIFTRSLVRIYRKGELVAVHPRNYKPGGYSTTPEHLSSHHQHYLKRSPDYYLKQASKRSKTLADLVELMFNDGRHPEQHYKSCDGLFNLHKKTQPQAFDDACMLAITHQNPSYKFVSNIIQNNMAGISHETKQKQLPAHPNIRGREYYKQTTINFNTHDANRNNDDPAAPARHDPQLANDGGNPPDA